MTCEWPAVHLSEFIRLNVSAEDIKRAIRKAQENMFMDNLRDRHPNVAFDSRLRGYVGEIAFKKWLADNGIAIETQNYFDDEAGMDIDFRYKGLDGELKTSLRPHADDSIERVFASRDLKLIRREEKRIEDFKGDIHVQIYYDQDRKQKDDWLKRQDVDLNSDDIDYLYESLLARSYVERATLLCGWIDKETLVKRINALPRQARTWAFGARRFWVCPLRDCFPPKSLITYLSSI